MNNQKRACFIDDDRDFLDVLQLRITHSRFQIQTVLATNGYQIIDQLMKEQPDVLFIDFNMPRAHGGQVISVLQSANVLCSTPVYFMTSHGIEKVGSLLKNIEYDGILEKGDTFSQEVGHILDRIK
ncbi:MAG: hypothetical protein A3G87_01630 [Omnitrophica bacterium RIFCSPLOWO2_12_FULL_50_11]|nr:MAG: hypothetical protein A3G87_01630 [Omnitrophica bacterium RIFCSPLOWO2_12_FULL_50_11]